MADDPKVLPFRPTLTPRPSERTITVSYSRFLLLLDAFADCAGTLHRKLKLLDDLYALLPGNDEVGMGARQEHGREEGGGTGADRSAGNAR